MIGMWCIKILIYFMAKVIALSQLVKFMQNKNDKDLIIILAIFTWHCFVHILTYSKQNTFFSFFKEFYASCRDHGLLKFNHNPLLLKRRYSHWCYWNLLGVSLFCHRRKVHWCNLMLMETATEIAEGYCQ